MTTDNNTLADAQPGGRVRLGDQAELDRLEFQAWAEQLKHTLTRWGNGPGDVMPLFVSEVAGNYISPATQAAWEAWRHLSAQPSPGGQGDAPSIDYEDLLDQAKDLIHCGCSVNGAFEWLLEQLTDGEALAAPPAQAVCSNCTGAGVIPYTSGQTPEQFEQGEYPCPECTPAQAVDLGPVHAALQAAARSLRTIADSTKDTEFLETASEIRAYANSRATCAEQALIDSQAVGNG